MKRFIFILGSILLGAYLLLHLVLGSSPVQRWVLEKVRATLQNYGVNLQIESIEFSALSPKIYLNRVKISTEKGAMIHLKDPLSIDKVKLSFQPLALIYKQIVIDEAILFHPQIFLPRADEVYRRVSQLLQSSEAIELEGGKGEYSVIVRRSGFVDALFNVESQNPPFAVRSRGLSVILSHEVADQRSLSIQSGNLELDRGPLKLNLFKVDIDADITANSVRLNRGIVSGPGIDLDLKLTSSLKMLPGKGPELLRGTYDIKLPLEMLTKFPELGVSEISGAITSSGTINFSDGNYQGQGNFGYQKLLVKGYQIDDGQMSFLMDGKNVRLTDTILRYAGGEIYTNDIAIDLSQPSKPIQGTLDLRSVKFEKILSSLKEPFSPVVTSISGPLALSGELNPLKLNGELNAQLPDFAVLDDGELPHTPENRILDFAGSSITGSLVFVPGQLNFSNQLNTLGGKVDIEGLFNYQDKVVDVSFNGTEVSFTQLREIAGLQMGGVATLAGELTVRGTEAQVGGTFTLNQGEIADIVLGRVSGQVVYKNQLLAFENLELPSLEPIKGSGFVDFAKKSTLYKFNVDIKRSPMDQIFGIFSKTKLGFAQPKSGEVEARVSIEGGHDDKGVEVVASGTSRNFIWYDEPWVSGQYIFTYRADSTELNRVMLLKQSGGLGVSGHFETSRSRLSFKSHNLRLEEFDVLGKAPIVGKLEGEVTLEGDGDSLMTSGYGEIKVLDAQYRNVPLENSLVRIRPKKEGLEFLGSLIGQGARGRYVRGAKGPASDELLLYFQKFDFAPIISLAMQKEISTFANVYTTGDLSLTGDFTNWKTLRGSGLISLLNVGLRSTPLRNKQPIDFKVNEGSIVVSPFQLVGSDAEINGYVNIAADKLVDARLAATLDLQYAQPFIPSVEYGAGKTTATLQVSGKPSDFRVLGNVVLENGVLRFNGLNDEFKNTSLQMSVSQDLLNITRLETSVNGGKLRVSGGVAIDRFSKFAPNLKLNADRVEMKFAKVLTTKLSGEMSLKGEKAPFHLSGECQLLQGRLSSFSLDAEEKSTNTDAPPAFTFDLNCNAKNSFFVQTDVMNAEFRGDFNLLGNSDQLGLLGSAEGIRGAILFRETSFDLEGASVKFESPSEIRPRFRVSGRTVVAEEGVTNPQEYEVSLQALGTPQDYRIRLSSNPPLTEGDITSLLLLGVTSQGKEGNYLQFGSTVLGQTPLQSKIQSELGVDIKIGTRAVEQNQQTSTTGSGDASGGLTVPTVEIQKKVTDKTKVTLSNTVGVAVPTSEIRIEQILDENLTVNATAGTQTRDEKSTTQSFGLDFRFNFEFE